jgi:tetratricopeptide (TPR) repeat protein
VTENPRIDELRRRVQADPTSIAFAALAEEYRRAGQYEDAVEVCRNGLNRHPQYLSARVTLGRALIELNQLDEARMELQQVLSIAPENLAAIRALAETEARSGEAAAEPPAPMAPPSGNGGFVLDLMPRTPIRLQTPEKSGPDPRTPVLAALNQLLDAVRALKSHSA